MPHRIPLLRRLHLPGRRLLWGAAAGVVLAGPVGLRAEPLPANPVEELRRYARAEKNSFGEAALTFRARALKEQVGALRTIGEMGQALLFNEWREEPPIDATAAMLDLQIRRKVGLPEDAASIDQAIMKVISERMADAIRAVVKSGLPSAQVAVSGYLGELSASIRGGSDKNPFVRNFLVGSTPLIAPLLESPDPAVRQATALAIGKIVPQPTAASKALAPLLRSPHVADRRAAASALAVLVELALQGDKRGSGTVLTPPSPAAPRPGGGLGGARPTLEQQNAQRDTLLQTGQAVVPVVGQALADADPEVRRHATLTVRLIARGAAEYLPIADNRENLPLENRPLSEAEREGLRQLRAAVVEEQKQFLPLLEALRKHAPALGRLLADADARVRLEAAQTLEDLGTVRQKLLKRAASVPVLGVESPVRKASANAAGDMAFEPEAPAVGLDPDPLLDGLRETLPALVAALGDPVVGVRLAVAQALEMVADRSALGGQAATVANGLTAALCDPDRFVRWVAARALGRLGSVSSADPVPGLAKLLGDPDLDLQLAAAVALERHGESAAGAVPELARRVVEGDPELRMAAMETLEAIGTAAAPALSGVAESLGAMDVRVRRAAAQTLSRFGPLAAGATTQLRQALQDEDAEVRRLASEALLSVLGGNR